MTNPRAVYSWLASGLFIGALLVVGVIMIIPPREADLMVYLSLGAGTILVVSSFVAFLGIEVRKLLSKSSLTLRAVRQAIRQGVEVGLVIVAGAALWILTGLSWWEGLLLILAVVFGELAISFRRKPQEVGK